MYNKALKIVEKYHEKVYIHSHLLPVVNLVDKYYTNSFYDLDIMKTVALLHDVLEDADCTDVDLSVYGISHPVIWMVKCLTKDKTLPNRKMKNLENYHRLRLSEDAIFVKLCDRIQNVDRCRLSLSDDLLSMYQKEHGEFKAALWHPKKYQNMWNDLEELLNI